MTQRYVPNEMIRALKKSLTLLEDAMENHIYDASNGEKPAPDCKFNAHCEKLRRMVGKYERVSK